MTFQRVAASGNLTQDVKDYLRMLSFRRPAKSQSEALFNKQYLDCLPDMSIDAEGNRILRIGGEPGTEGFYPVLWSSHTDTVHTQPGFQKISYDINKQQAFISDQTAKAGSNCLGADCTSGVWLMREMIMANVPGLYIFHSAEEVGGIGSQYIADKTPELLRGIQYAIAFDRRGTSSVITHQFTRCASNAFANALADLLGEEYEPDDGGTFTDTANYTDLIPECTNISVGYHLAHSKNEEQDVGFLLWLRDRMLAIGHQIITLPVARDPKAHHDYPSYYRGGGGWWSKYGSNQQWPAPANPYTSIGMGHYNEADYRDMQELVSFYPDTAARLLLEAGISPGEFRATSYS
jgi:hypothetical protein